MYLPEAQVFDLSLFVLTSNFRNRTAIVLSIENYTFNRVFNHKFMIYKDKYQFSLSHV
jgi:hypothetical protein